MIKIKNLSKKYKIIKKEPGLKGAIKALYNPKYELVHAVNNINFSISEGEIVGYIGSNGAGKSTTIKMMSGILTPDNGEILVNGIIPYKNRKENAQQVGAVFGQRTQLYWDIPIRESFELLKHIYAIPEEEYNKNLNHFIEILNLNDLLDKPVRQLSLGQKMRCELASCFLHDPKIVYLDEPTIGLDVSVKEKIRAFISYINQKKKTTIILTTHDMQDIEVLCNRVIIIDKGTIIYDGDIKKLKNNSQYNRLIEMEIENIGNNFIYPSEFEGLVEYEIKTNSIKVHYNSIKVSSQTILLNFMNKYEISDFTITEPDIGRVVQDIYNGSADQ
ncbi:ATP-binding cassette domain-containing protein [Bacillus mycoides]|uniref:Sugar ABC transporter ATP-binding protein n=1 Tax=Bacillus mycoides TaxID=1405 RepID=A0A1S9T0Z4_BACMY|nr:ATP-binding cassette domain-containing protein [Bacillus mycoides]OOR03675.1 sugar ABC transporter ATP-binding protein [Bacillus mycoides]